MTRRSVVPSVVFLLGPSGVGKTTLGRALEESARFLHLNIDRYPEGDGIDLEGLRSEWTKSFAGDAKELASTLRLRATGAGRAGVVLSFPSLLILKPERIEAIARDGITTVVLHGTPSECLDAFLRHERSAHRVSGDLKAHWEGNNRAACEALGRAEYDSVRLTTFQGGRHRPVSELVEEVRRRTSNEHSS